MKRRGIRAWLDREELRPRDSWIEMLDNILSKVDSAAVFVGSIGTVPWEKMEIRVLLRRFVDTGVREIPVILEGATEEPDWGLFLDTFRRGDFPSPLRTSSGK